MTVVYTLPPGLPFLRTLAETMLSGDLPRAGGTPPGPIDLAKTTLLLPTRRATRALQEAFLAASGGKALLLPKIKAIGDGNEDLSLLSGAAGLTELGPESGTIAPAVGELERRLVLTQLVMRWSETMRSDDVTVAAGANTPAQAAALAAELARLMDMVETEGVSLNGLADLVPEDFAAHWNRTIEFLKIIVEAWPAYLTAAGKLSAADRRNRVLRAEAERLAAAPPADPIIVAGVTGSIPAAAELMKVIATLPQGAIVVPGLDLSLDDHSFALAATKYPEHPQHGLAKLLSSLGLDRAAVTELGRSRLSKSRRARAELLSEALRPAETTDSWHLLKSKQSIEPRAALAGVHLLEAQSAQDEAETVALILRHAVETPGRTAALVSPDRLLARRVIVRLKSWGITVDDSAGRPFAKTVPGAFIDLAIEAAAQDFAPPALMALLKHPLTRLGMSARDVRRAGRYLELAAFRGIYLGRGLDGVEAGLEIAAQETAGDSNIPVRRPKAVQRLWTDNWQAALDLVARLKAAYAPWTALAERNDHVPLQQLARAHIDVARELAKHPAVDNLSASSAVMEGTDIPENNPLFAEEAGEAAQALFVGLLDEGLIAPALRPSEYPDFYRGLVATESVRPRHPVHPRIAILGPFESRLQQPDVVILGSLNDGTWPDSADPGPWLNRPMRSRLGLPAPEEKIGHAAHDFSMLLGADKVYLTRATKIDGVPTVPSRWLMRIAALLNGFEAKDALAADEPWLAWARTRDAFVPAKPLRAPQPAPPIDLRPRSLSVTDIERWIANPYAIFAAHILELEELPPLGATPDQRLRGTIIHDALGRFAKRYPPGKPLPDDIAAALLREADAVMTTFAANARVAAFWRPRLARFAGWFAETESQRRHGVTQIAAEKSGRTILAAPAGPFTLRARADRIDTGEGIARLIDYKTGSVPSATDVKEGRKPQLPLEALILQDNGFEGVTNRLVTALTYIRATGGEPPGEETDLKLKDIQHVIAAARTGLSTLIATYDDPATPYKALRRGSLKAAYDYDTFAHLARVSEWSAGGENEES